MEFVPIPETQASSLKKPLVELEVVDRVPGGRETSLSSEQPVDSFQEESGSDSEVDSDSSGAEWDNESLFEDVIQPVRDEQLALCRSLNPIHTLLYAHRI